MKRQQSVHTMSDSSSEEDDVIGVPLAQRLAKFSTNSVFQSHGPNHTESVSNNSAKSATTESALPGIKPGTIISGESDAVLRPGQQINDGEVYVGFSSTRPVLSRNHLAHTMSDSDSDELPNLDTATETSNNNNSNKSAFRFKEHKTTGIDLYGRKIISHTISDSDSDSNPGVPSLKVSKSTEVYKRTLTNYSSAGLKPDDKKRLQEAKKFEKETLKREREAEREGKRKTKEMEAKRKRFEREQAKRHNVKDCINYMSVCIDEHIVRNPCGADIQMVLKNAGIKYDVQKQSYPNIITFWRETIEEIDTGDNLRTEIKEKMEDNVLIWLPIEEFIAMVNNHVQKQLGNYLSPDQQTLREFVEMAKATLENISVTLLVQGLENYFKTKKGAKKGKPKSNNTMNVSRLEVDQVLMDVQVCTSCNVRLMEKDSEVAQTVMQFTKAIAETPFKRGRMVEGLSFHIDNKGSVKVEKDGAGLLQLWRQQITQFHNITGQVADAIIREYPAPMLLYQAYRSCDSEKQKERLLEDIMVRRVHGPVQSSRRVGKEMSRRMYRLFSETDPNFVLT